MKTLLKKAQKKKICPLYNLVPSHFLGDANLHVNVSVELTGETFDLELTKRGSEMFTNRSLWIKTQVCKCDSHCHQGRSEGGGGVLGCP